MPNVEYNFNMDISLLGSILFICFLHLSLFSLDRRSIRKFEDKKVEREKIEDDHQRRKQAADNRFRPPLFAAVHDKIPYGAEKQKHLPRTEDTKRGKRQFGNRFHSFSLPSHTVRRTVTSSAS